MPELNPYEAPQSDSSDLRQHPESVNVSGYPEWIGRALNAQMTLILGLMILAMFVTGLPNWISNLIAILVMLVYGSLAVALLTTAIRYRIGWLLLLELIVIGLPLMMLIA